MLWALFMPLRRESLVAIAAADAYIHIRAHTHTHTHIYIYRFPSGERPAMGPGFWSVIESCYARVQYVRSIARKGVVSPMYIHSHTFEYAPARTCAVYFGTLHYHNIKYAAHTPPHLNKAKEYMNVIASFIVPAYSSPLKPGFCVCL